MNQKDLIRQQIDLNLLYCNLFGSFDGLIALTALVEEMERDATTSMA